MAVLNLTESRIRDMEFGSGIWRDAQVKGLLVICHATTKTYAVQGDVRRHGRHIRTVRVKIDRVDRIGLREARNRARAIMSQIQSGVDPTAKARETGITLLQALEEHLKEKPLRDATVESYRYNIEHYLGRYRNRAVADLSRSEVRDIYQNLRESKGQPIRDRRDADLAGGRQHGAAHRQDADHEPRRLQTREFSPLRAMVLPTNRARFEGERFRLPAALPETTSQIRPFLSGAFLALRKMIEQKGNICNRQMAAVGRRPEWLATPHPERAARWCA